MSGSPPTEDKHVGCPWCTRGNVPVWSHTGQEFVHVMQEKYGDKGQHTRVVSTVCTAFSKSASAKE